LLQCLVREIGLENDCKETWSIVRDKRGPGGYLEDQAVPDWRPESSKN
jgi:hypothetical protein